MSARELVGRPLVPFFDAEDNVNEALSVDMATQAQEQLDVDARVWDRELGYFVYPNEDATASSTSHAHSQPIAIKRTNASASASATAQTSADGAGSYGKLLLTPDMLSRSAPSDHSSGMEQMQNHHNHTAAAAASTNATPRSASAKRASRQKSRSSTPNKSRNKQQTTPPVQTTQGQPSTSDGGSSGGEDRTNGSDGSDKSKVKKNGETRKSRTKQQQQQQPPKNKDEPAGNGKWAWSAFQSSPDPKSLPLPPFVAGGGTSPGVGSLPPPFDPPKIEERLDPPAPPGRLDRPPSVPPDAPPIVSIEHSMTQDLRRMLNIGS